MKQLFSGEHHMSPKIDVNFRPEDEVELHSAGIRCARKSAGPVLTAYLSSLPREIVDHPNFVVDACHQDFRNIRPHRKSISGDFHVDSLLSIDDLLYLKSEELKRILEEGEREQFGLCSWGDCVHTEFVDTNLEIEVPDYPGTEWLPGVVEQRTKQQGLRVKDLPDATPLRYSGTFIHRRGEKVYTPGIRYLAIWEIRNEPGTPKNIVKPFRI